MTETELKSIIDEETYTKIKRAVNWERVVVQENHYYTDKDGILRENRVMVRIRVIDGTGKIQVKRHVNRGSALQICEETEFSVDGVPETLTPDKAREITGMDVGALCKMGCAVTKRRTISDDTTELCLDKTTYFDKTDYEVEAEYTGKVSAELLAKLTAFGVSFDKKSVGKFSRFLKEYNKRNEKSVT